jgi:four helix bundle protein
MGFTTYRDIDSWKRARALTRDIYHITTSGALAQDFGLRDQMRRSAVSVMSNIAEGFGRSGNREFIRFLTYARGSILELETQLIVAQDVGFIDSNQFQHLSDQCSAIQGLLCGLIRYLRKHESAVNRR